MTHPLHSAVIWLTGPPASGKTTLAAALNTRLRAAELAVLWLDSDDLRPVLMPEAGYDDADRHRFYGAVAHLARRAAEGGCTVLISATASRRAHRAPLRRSVPRFHEVLLTCDPETLRARDPKGLYARADAGELPHLPGATAPYEPPDHPLVILDTGRLSVDAAVARLAEALGLPG
ncbi:MAG: adenylyl-sulfate kinase [Myxococcales bacterium]|nr:adenylyl-sulfate kinase [Myxococcales bacterium]